MLTRSAIGLYNADDAVPIESTYCLFRKRVNDYAKAGNENLFHVLFTELTQNKCIDFNVSGKRIRMDSKLLDSNIAWLSRYELVHETLRMFYKPMMHHEELDKATEERLNELLKLEGNKVQEVLLDKIESVHTDDVYHSPSNQIFCKDNQISLYFHAIQGAKGRYQFIVMENGEFAIFDTKTNRLIEPYKLICKNGISKWRIETGNGYRYFTQKEVDTYQIRKQIAETPVEILQFRNNVEATIFQLGYHYSNDKSRYRGLIKHQMWANIRCLWVNFVRILKYIT